jgi:hypothetical protein
MKACLLAVALLVIPVCVLYGSNEQDALVEHSKPIARTSANLGTTRYHPTPTETAATRRWSKEDLKSGGSQITTLQARPGTRVAWFGIVREVDEDKSKNETHLTVEMKYDDGLTDLHLQIVSLYGAGDFKVIIPKTGHGIKKLSLVRVYGQVVSDPNGVPLVEARFVRDWDWKLFAFMPYGEDKSNPKWVKLRKVDKLDIYSSEPDDRYYEERLGNR